MTSADNTDKPTSELAADVRAALDAISGHGPWYRQAAYDALDALVARVTDLEAQAEKRQKQLSELVRTARSEQQRADAAEAQVATLTQERDEAQAALTEVRDYTSPENVVGDPYGRFAIGRMQDIARRALAAAGDNTTPTYTQQSAHPDHPSRHRADKNTTEPA